MTSPKVAWRMASPADLPDGRNCHRFYGRIPAGTNPECAPSSAGCFKRRGQSGDEYIVDADYYGGVGSGAFSYLGGTF